MAILTVSGQFGSRGEDIARELARRTGFRLLTREVVEQQMRELCDMEPPALATECEQSGANGPDANGNANGRLAAELNLYANLVTIVVADLATAEDFVLVELGGQCLFLEAYCAAHLRVVAPRSWRAATVAAELGLAPPAAAQLVARQDAAQARYLRMVFGCSAQRSDLYHLVLNTAALDQDHAVNLAMSAVDSLRLRSAGQLSTEAGEHMKVQSKMRLARHFAELPGAALLEHVSFAHPSERVFARLMDFYRIEWEYEPRTFPIEWNEQGVVVEAFTPDFYLPELNLYVELTTMKQSLVTRKNRKVKRLRELHPEVNIRVFYQKDVEDLIFKLGAPYRREELKVNS